VAVDSGVGRWLLNEGRGKKVKVHAKIKLSGWRSCVGVGLARRSDHVVFAWVIQTLSSETRKKVRVQLIAAHR
jgi:hypothetical protein